MSADATAGLDWLYSTQLFGIKLGLENVHRLLTALELPPPGMKFIHVAGTNGKGSTCAFLHSLLGEAGINAGLFTSPHLVRFNERIRDRERMIDDAEIEAGLRRLRDLVSNWEPHPTFFELTFALALDWFRARGLQWVILETGLGGRLDATNAIRPVTTVITSIGWDHMSILGDSLEKIAAEKAGIFKPGVPAITQPQADVVMGVLQREARRQGAELQIAPVWEEGMLGLSGTHQRQNAGLAVAAVGAAGVHLTQAQVQHALSIVSWPGRFQLCGHWILDGAHNPEAVQALVRTWQEQFGDRKTTVVFGAASDKDTGQMLRLLAPIVEEWRFTGFHSPRALPPEALVEQLRQELGSVEVKIQLCLTVVEALVPPVRSPGLVAGSLFLVGESLSILQGQRSPLRQTAQ